MAEGTSEENQLSSQVPPFLLDPKGILERRWRWMTAAALLGLFATGALVATWKPRYEAETTIVITSQRMPDDLVTSTVRPDSLANIGAMLGKVMSQVNLAKLIREFELYPELQGKVSLADLVVTMRDDIWSYAHTSQGSGEDSIVYALAYLSDDPQTAATVANALASLFIESSVARRNNEARQTTAFLRRELERNERELRDHGERMSRFRREHRGELPSELDTKLARLNLLSERRDALVAQIGSAENRIIAIGSRPRGDRTPNERLLADLQTKLSQERAVNTDEHPNVVALKRQYSNQKAVVKKERDASGGLSGEAAGMVGSERREVALYRSQLRDVERQIIELNSSVDRVPAAGEELDALKQKETVLREDYVNSLRKVERAELAESLEAARQGSQIQVLDPAIPPTAPRRSRIQLAVIGILASLIIAAVTALLLEIFDSVVITSTQLEEISSERIMGSVPRIT